MPTFGHELSDGSDGVFLDREDQEWSALNTRLYLSELAQTYTRNHVDELSGQWD